MTKQQVVYYPPPLPVNSDDFLTAFGRGASLPFRGVSFLSNHPRLWPLVIVPLLLNMILFAAVLTWGFTTFAGGLDSWTQALEGWFVTPIKIALQVFFWLIVVGVVYLICTPVALLIAAPFNDRIAEHTEHAYGFVIPGSGRSKILVLAGEVLFSILSEAKRLVFTLGVLALLLPLCLLPIIGSPLYLIASLTWGAWSMAFEFSSYAADRRRMGVRKKVQLLRRAPGAAFGFGSVALLMLLVPFLNVLMVPMLAIGGTMLFCMLAHTKGTTISGA